MPEPPRDYLILAVDFDGTLCDNAWPDIGQPRQDLIDELRAERATGRVRLILWTCRRDHRLQEALAWAAERGLQFDAVNENLPGVIEEFGDEARKIYADLYIDDRASHPDFFLNGCFAIQTDIRLQTLLPAPCVCQRCETLMPYVTIPQLCPRCEKEDDAKGVRAR